MKYIKTFEDFINESKLNEAKDFSAYDDIKKYKNLKGKRVEYNFGTAKKPDIQKIKIDSIQVSNAGGNSKIKVVAYATRSDKNTVIVPVTSIENIEDYVMEGANIPGIGWFKHNNKFIADNSGFGFEDITDNKYKLEKGDTVEVTDVNVSKKRLTISIVPASKKSMDIMM